MVTGLSIHTTLYAKAVIAAFENLFGNKVVNIDVSTNGVYIHNDIKVTNERISVYYFNKKTLSVHVELHHQHNMATIYGSTHFFASCDVRIDDVCKTLESIIPALII